jgi:hypothetical protein
VIIDIPLTPGTGNVSIGEGIRTADPTKIIAAAVEGSTCHCDPLPYLRSLSRVSVSVMNMIHTGSELFSIVLPLQVFGLDMGAG